MSDKSTSDTYHSSLLTHHFLYFLRNCIQKMITALLRKLLLGVLFFYVAISHIQATHIIGGELNYACLGDNQYEISLTVYRDCYLGEALMDDTAYVAVYDQLGMLLQTVPILLGDVDTVLQADECLLAPPDICVETTIYKDTIALRPRIGGYHIAYQRCCRNATILNIVDPLNTGATYDIILTEEAMNACNASPKIQAWPPTFICANRPLQFDHSAYDRENDSLVYKLCTPFTGGISMVNPRPRPAFPPPYKNIVWKTPTYDLNNLLGGLPLKIDPATGILTGTPTTIGQFVVGVCVEEYRNGQLISETRRDFQYNVIPCQDVTADFTVPASQCGDLTVQPEDISLGATTHQWKFMAGNQVLATSSDIAPSYTFPDTGRYSIRLVVDKNSPCIDSTEKQIALIPNSLKVDFSHELIGCQDSLFLQLTDGSSSPNGMPVEWQWIVTGTKDSFSSTQSSPRFNIENNQTIDIQLQVMSDNGCTSTSQKKVDVFVSTGLSALAPVDTLVVCEQEPIALNPSFDPNLSYNWSPQEGLSDPNISNPTIIATAPTTYTVAISDSIRACFFERSIFVNVLSLDTDFDFDMIYLSCAEDLTIAINPVLPIGYQQLTWTLNDGNSTFPSDEKNPTFSITPTTVATVTGTMINEQGCETEVTKGVNTQLLATISLPDTVKICQGETVQLNPSPNLPDYQYQWLPISNINNASIANPVVDPMETTTYTLKYQDTSRPCFIEKKVVVEVLPVLQDFEVATTYQCDNRTVRFTPNQLGPIEWDFGDNSPKQITTNAVSITHTYAQAGDYILQITTDKEASCSNVLTLPVSVLERNAVVDFDWSTENCTDTSIELIVEDLSKIVHGNITNWTWELSNGLSSDQPEASFIITNNDSIDIKLSIIVDNDPSCITSLQLNIPPLLLESTISDSLLTCRGVPIELNPAYQENYDYEWYPLEGLINAATANPTAILVNSKKYSVNITNDYGCQTGQEVSVIVPPKIDIQTTESINICERTERPLLTAFSEQPIQAINWLDQNGEVLGRDTAIELPFIETGTSVSVHMEDTFGCQEEKTIAINYQPIISTTSDTLFACHKTDLFLNENYDNRYEYSWSPAILLTDATAANPLVSLEYSTKFLVTITNEMDCAITQEVVVQVAPEIIVEKSEDFITCDQELSGEIFAYSDQATQQWWLDVKGDTLGYGAELPFIIEQTTQLTAALQDQFGCVEQTTIDIQYEPVEVAYDASQQLCQEDSLQLLVENLHPSQALQFDWSPLSTIIEGSTGNSPLLYPLTSTTYEFLVTNQLGCTTQGAIAVEVLQELPMVNINTTSNTIISGASVELVATQNTGYTYNWTPASTLNDPSIANPVAMPMEDTKYQVLVTDENGCTNTAQIEIQVQTALCETPYIFLPSGFTPNGDGENDVLFVRGEIIKELQFIIYDRWGDKLFETTNQSIGWDGTNNGRRLPSGVFGYYLYAGCFNGGEYYKQGNITLVR